MENNTGSLPFDEEKSLDEWVDSTLAPIADTIYFICSTISQFMDSLKLD